jgi:flavin-dependent dehydrogenase
MIIDGKNLNSDLNCDVTIVGAGTVGLFIANQLKETYKKIIVIEKGDLYLKKKKTFLKIYRRHIKEVLSVTQV